MIIPLYHIQGNYPQECSHSAMCFFIKYWNMAQNDLTQQIFMFLQSLIVILSENISRDWTQRSSRFPFFPPWSSCRASCSVVRFPHCTVATKRKAFESGLNQPSVWLMSEHEYGIQFRIELGHCVSERTIQNWAWHCEWTPADRVFRILPLAVAEPFQI